MGSCMGFHTPARWARPLLVLGARARSSVIPWQHVGALAAQTRALDWRKLASIPMHLEVLCFPESETASRRVGAGDRVLLGHLLHREAPRPRRRGLASRSTREDLNFSSRQSQKRRGDVTKARAQKRSSLARCSPTLLSFTWRWSAKRRRRAR